jgi:hypothetical protein
MWRIYLIKFIVAIIISILWVHIINKHKNDKDESN